MENIRQDFPILETKIKGRQLIYLDNAATMQMLTAVQRRMQLFYEAENANIHRGIHTLSENATSQYEEARNRACQFMQEDDTNQILFTSGTTDAVNQVAEMAGMLFEPGDEILITEMEHHSNFIPWYQLCKRCHLTLQIVRVDRSGQLDLDHLESLLHKNTRLVAFTELSNVTGIETPANEIISRIRSRTDAMILLDGAQGIVHSRKKLSDVDCDFYCFSGHKLGAPTGTGILSVKDTVFKKLSPSRFGGGTVDRVSREEISFIKGVSAFEPGTPNYAGIIGLSAALDYWSRYPEAARYEASLLKALEQGLGAIEGVHILGETDRRKGCISVTVDDVHPYDLCSFLDLHGIAARSGHLCAMPYLNALRVEHAIRFSVAPYNTLDEINTVLNKFEEITAKLRWSRPHPKPPHAAPTCSILG